MLSVAEYIAKVSGNGRPARDSSFNIPGSEANGTGRSACATVPPPLLAVLQKNIVLPAAKV